MSPTELMSPDLLRFAFVMGMVLSVFLYEKSHLTTGSIVVPGFLGAHIFEPVIVLTLILNAWICFCLIHQIAPRFCFMNNKTKFHTLIVVSVLLQLAWDLLSTLQLPIAIASSSMSGLGYVLPGLIAHDMSRNGALKTGVNVLAVSSIVGAMVYFLLVVSPRTALNQNHFEPHPFSFDLTLVLVMSTISSVFLKLKTSVRSAGYVTAAYLVFFMNSPVTLLAIMVAALTTYQICRRFLIPRMIVFGRRKFALILIVGALLMWGLQLFLKSAGIHEPLMEHPLYAGILVLLPGLIANDMQRTGVLQVVIGLGLLVSWVAILAGLLCEFFAYSRPQEVVRLIGCLGGIFLIVLFLKKSTDEKVSTTSIQIDHGVAT